MQWLLNPAVLCPLLWAVIIAGANLSNLDFYPLSGRFYAYIVTVVAAFSLAAVAGQQTGQRFTLASNVFRRIAQLDLRLSPNGLANLYIAVMAFSLFFQTLDHMIMSGSQWFLPAGLILYRVSISDLGLTANYGFTSLLNYFFFSAGPLLWLFGGSIPRAKKIAIVAMLAYFIYLSTARASFFTVALIAGYFVLQYRPRITLVAGAALVIFFAFELIGSLVGKAGFDAFWIYLYAPMYALDQILAGVRTDVAGTVYSFSVIRPLLTRLGMISFQPWSLLSYYETPYRTNVYTVFGPYVLDFGILGSILWLSLFGFISGLIHGLRIRYRHIPYLAFLSALSLTLLTLGVFYDYYTSAGYVWLSLIFSTLLFPRELPDEKSLAVFGGLPARRNAGGSIIPDTALV